MFSLVMLNTFLSGTTETIFLQAFHGRLKVSFVMNCELALKNCLRTVFAVRRKKFTTFSTAKLDKCLLFNYIHILWAGKFNKRSYKMISKKTEECENNQRQKTTNGSRSVSEEKKKL